MPRKAQRRAFGSVTEVVPGKKYVVRWVQNTETGRRRLSKTVRGTRREANRLLAEKELAHGGEERAMTVGDAYGLWYAPWLEGRVRDGRTSGGTARQYSAVWERHAGPRWATVPLDKVAPLEVQRWLSGMSKVAAHTAITVLRAVVDLAVRYEAVSENKFRKRYEMPVTTSRARSRETYDLATARAVLGRLEGRPSEAPFILACFGSCRTGESLAVRLEDVTERDGYAVVRIDKRMPDGSRAPVHELKNAQSVRSVIIPPPYSGRLFAIARERREFGTDWLCDRGDGTPADKRILRQWWVSDSGGSFIPFANLRNSWRTFAQYEWRVDYDTCELLMGHALPGVTGRHYLRPDVTQLLERVDSALQESGNLP